MRGTSAANEPSKAPRACGIRVRPAMRHSPQWGLMIADAGHPEALENPRVAHNQGTAVLGKGEACNIDTTGVVEDVDDPLFP